ncbi:ABC transporter permease [Dictyobacter formicarum]|uniref:ABC transporter permease n=1 Tax=Dictyobacter formicarum TaxID=2778368 RepID=A0ABQ3VFV4_9CHLR|nr:ABC-2 family transporter protein [Dictyobacter formicarum]GHO84594.1 hypothetical protein KSZ_26000 [Dictyobacter formicarum]
MLQGYLKLAMVEIQTMLAYRTATIIWCIGALLRIYLLNIFWSAIYGGQSMVDGVTLPAIVTYATLSIMQQNFIIANDISWRIQERIREGNIIIDLLRPYGYLRSLLAMGVGNLAFTIPVAGVTILVAALFGNLILPASPVAAVVYLISLLLGFLLSFLFSCLIGFTAFWTFELSGINWLMDMVISFLSGVIVPLWFLPPVVQQISDFLPFQGIGYLPLSIYIGRITGNEMWLALIKQLCWVSILTLLVVFVWRLAQKKLIVQRG